MTEKELDAFMSKVLLDAIAFDEDRLEEKIPYAASARHRRQRALGDPTGVSVPPPNKDPVP